jgi:hypothetical protein
MITVSVQPKTNQQQLLRLLAHTALKHIQPALVPGMYTHKFSKHPQQHSAAHQQQTSQMHCLLLLELSACRSCLFLQA